MVFYFLICKTMSCSIFMADFNFVAEQIFLYISVDLCLLA